MEYWRGRRARHVAPLQLYLFVSFIYFFIADVLLDVRGGWQDSFTRGGAESPERVAAFIYEGFAWSFFFIVPAIAAVLRLLYRRHERFFLPHLVFAVHFFAAGFVINITAIAVDALFAPLLDLDTLLFVWSVIHVLLFLALRRAYGEPPVKTLAKQACLVAFVLRVRSGRDTVVGADRAEVLRKQLGAGRVVQHHHGRYGRAGPAAAGRRGPWCPVVRAGAAVAGRRTVMRGAGCSQGRLRGGRVERSGSFAGGRVPTTFVESRGEVRGR